MKHLSLIYSKTKVFLAFVKHSFHVHKWERNGFEDDLTFIHKSDKSKCYWRKFKCIKCGAERKEFSW